MPQLWYINWNYPHSHWTYEQIDTDNVPVPKANRPPWSKILYRQGGLKNFDYKTIKVHQTAGLNVWQLWWRTEHSLTMSKQATETNPRARIRKTEINSSQKIGKRTNSHEKLANSMNLRSEMNSVEAECHNLKLRKKNFDTTLPN